jgi:chromosome segregation ATPase
MSSTLLPHFNILKFLNLDLTLFLCDPRTWSSQFINWWNGNQDSSSGIFGIKITVLILIYGFLASIWFACKNKIKVLNLNSNPYQANLAETESGIKDLKAFYQLIKESHSSYELKGKINKYFDEPYSETNLQSSMYISLEHAWKEFSEGVHEYKEQLMNVYQAEDFFKVNTIVSPYVFRLKHYPSFFTSTGLLFTFIALTAGLSVVRQEAGGGDITGLDDFINALSAKFVTSIVGLILAINAEITIKNKEHEMHETLSSIIYELNKNFKRLTTQDLLIDVQKDVKVIPEKISNYFDKTSETGTILNNIQNSITEGVKKAVSEIQNETSGVKNTVSEIKAEMEKVSKSMENFSAAGLNGMSEQLGTIGKELREGLTQGLSSDIDSLKSTMEKLPEIIQSTLSEMSRSTAEMKLGIADSQKLMTEQISHIFEEIKNKQGDSINQLLESLMNKSSELTSSLVSQQEEMQRRHSESMNLISQKLFETNDSSSKQTNELLAQMQNGVNKLMENLNQQTGGLTENLAKSSQNLHEQYIRQQSESQSLQDQFRQEIEDILNRNRNNFEPIINDLKDNINLLSKQTLAMPEELNKAQGSLNYALEKITNLLNNEFNNFINKQNELTASQKESLSDLHQYLNRVATLKDESIKIQTSMDKLIELQKKITDSSDAKDKDFKDQLELLRVAMQQQKNLMDQHQQANKELQRQYHDINQLTSSITTEFSRAGDSMAKSINTIKDSGHGYFDNFSKHHADAIKQLQGLINEMSEVISNSQFKVKP